MTHCQNLESKKVPTKLHSYYGVRIKGMAISKRWDRWTCSRILEFPRRIERRRWTVKSDRIVVPRAMRAKILDEIHCAHMGESTSLSFARDYLFWPAMTPQVKDRVRSCGICSAFRNQQLKETLKPHQIPGLPRAIVGTDLFEYGGQPCVVVTDFYSKYFELELCDKTLPRAWSTIWRRYLQGTVFLKK